MPDQPEILTVFPMRTHRLHSSSLSGFILRILNSNPKTGTTMEPMGRYLQKYDGAHIRAHTQRCEHTIYKNSCTYCTKVQDDVVL